MSPPATWTSFPRWPNSRGLLCRKTGTVTPSSLGCSHSGCAGKGALVHLLRGRLPATGLVIHAQFWKITGGLRGFPDGSVGKESACNAGDPGLIPGSGRSPGEGKGFPLQYSWASRMAQLVKNLPAIQETWVGKIPWRRAWQPTPVFLPGESPGTEEPGRIQFIGSQRVGHG